MDKWDRTIQEIRYPYDFKSGDTPEICTGDDLELSLGGDFLFFNASASVKLTIDTLWENRWRLGFVGTANLFNKLQVEAELVFNEYDGQILPDKILFAASSDLIGLPPAVPVIKLSKLGFAINDIGRTFGGHGESWNYIPPASVTLIAGGQIGIPHTKFDLGFEDARLTVGPSVAAFEMNEVRIGPLKIANKLSLGFTADFSKGVEIPGTNGFKLSMPILQLSGRGTLGLAFDQEEDKATGQKALKIPQFASGGGGFSFKVDGGILFQAFLDTLTQEYKNSATYISACNDLKAWAAKPGDKDMVALQRILTRLGFDIYDATARFAERAIMGFTITGDIQGKIYIPENIPVIGGWSVAEGSLDFSMVNGIMTFVAKGSVLGGIAKGSATIIWDMVKRDFTFKLMSAGIGAPGGESFMSGIQSVEISGGNGVQMYAANFSDIPVIGNSFTISADDTNILVGVVVSSKTDITLTSNAGGSVTVSAADAGAWVPLYDALGDGSIGPDDGIPPYAYRCIVELGGSGPPLGAAGTVWTVDGDGIMAVEAVNASPPEEISGIALAFGSNNTVNFTLKNASDGATYTAGVYLISESGTVILVAEGIAVNTSGATAVTIPAHILVRLQSGNYYASVFITKEADGEIRYLSGLSGSAAAVAYVNPATPAQAEIDDVDYIGDGIVSAQIKDMSDGLGYEIWIKDLSYTDDGEGNSVTQDMFIDYAPGSAVVFGNGLAADDTTTYTVYIRAYAVQDGTPEDADNGFVYKIYGAWSAGYNFTIQAPAPATVDVSDPGGFIRNSADGLYYAKQSFAYAVSTGVEDEIITEYTSDENTAAVFAAVCAGHTVIVTKNGLDYDYVNETGNLDYSLAVDLAEAASYTVIIYTLSDTGDTGRYVFCFVVNGTQPAFILDATTAIYDGTALTVQGYLESGAVVDTGVWTYDESDEGIRRVTGNYGGTWTGTASYVTRDVELSSDDDAETVVKAARVYEFTLIARNFTGNTTEVLLQLVSLLDDEGQEGAVGIAQLILRTNAGTRLSLGMTGIKVSASLLLAPFYNESNNLSGALSLSSGNHDVITIDGGGNITVVGAGTAVITGTYNGVEAALTIYVADTLAFGAFVTEATENRIVVSLPALPGFTGTLTVSDGRTVYTLSGPFDQPQELIFAGTDGSNAVTITLSHDCAAYSQANIYLAAVTAWSEPGDTDGPDDPVGPDNTDPGQPDGDDEGNQQQKSKPKGCKKNKNAVIGLIFVLGAGLLAFKRKRY